ncbi:MAG: sigma 54-interacting transcriptional regulator [Clostridia bacterium]|nr:sigma 54-interacting transcriptional regulator [Clostridia bacterium]
MKKILRSVTAEELIHILDSISDAVFIDDKDGISLWCNKACEELFKISLNDISGHHISELEKKGIFAPSVASMVFEQKKEVTIVHENKDGKRILSTGTPILDDNGQISKVVTTSRDITELSTLQNRFEAVESALKDLKDAEKFSYKGIVANSQQMFNVMQLTKRLANLDSTVLITGESGVGKGVIAELLHENGNRKDFPFIKVNCGAIPESLIESELFGYESGAFTGSRAEGKKGLFEEAQNGTIFLDEISELPLNLQVTLLQVIQEREIKRVGGVKSIPINVRIISATNKELHNLVQEGKFREDLYYRLNVVPINVPPLRERAEDIVPLIQLSLERYNAKLNDHKRIDPTAMAVLLKYNWPGNIRELQNIIERLVITTRGEDITSENLPSYIHDVSREQKKTTEDMTLSEFLEKSEREFLEKALKKCSSTRAMAKMLEVSQPTVVRKLQRYGLKSGDR